MAKAKVQSISWDKQGNVMTISYAKIEEAVVVDKRKLKPSIREYAEVHGLTQRFGDLESGDKVGQAKFDAAMALRDQYETSEEWSRQVERDTLSELCLAVSMVKPQFTIEEIRTAAELEPDQVADWRDDNDVRVELAKMRVAKAEARVAADPKPKKLVIKGLGSQQEAGVKRLPMRIANE